VWSGFHKRFNAWVDEQPDDGPLPIPTIEGDPEWTVDNVAAPAGALVLWHSYLPCVSRRTSNYVIIDLQLCYN